MTSSVNEVRPTRLTLTCRPAAAAGRSVAGNAPEFLIDFSTGPLYLVVGQPHRVETGGGNLEVIIGQGENEIAYTIRLEDFCGLRAVSRFSIFDRADISKDVAIAGRATSVYARSRRTDLQGRIIVTEVFPQAIEIQATISRSIRGSPDKHTDRAPLHLPMWFDREQCYAATDRRSVRLPVVPRPLRWITQPTATLFMPLYISAIGVTVLSATQALKNDWFGVAALGGLLPGALGTGLVAYYESQISPATIDEGGTSSPAYVEFLTYSLGACLIGYGSGWLGLYVAALGLGSDTFLGSWTLLRIVVPLMLLAAMVSLPVWFLALRRSSLSA